LMISFNIFLILRMILFHVIMLNVKISLKLIILTVALHMKNLTDRQDPRRY
jgi:hypothetical protein